MKDPLFEKVYNKKLLDRLERHFGLFQTHHAELPASTKVMLSLMQKMASQGRRGEVVMIIPDETKQVWLHTKNFYPQDVYRLMTGGLKPEELPDKAFRRETREETGLQVEIEQCLAVITYQFHGPKLTLPFVSYLFLAKPTSSRPRMVDVGENISAFKAVPHPALFDVAQHLRVLEGDFADWGYFRAIAHELAGQYFRSSIPK